MSVAIPGGARIYLRPIGFIDAPFGHDGATLRLAGGLVWFSAVELIIAHEGRRFIQRHVPVEQIDAVIGELPQPLQARAASQLQRLTSARQPLRLGERMIPLDQPQVMAILNVTPDSFSDGGQHADPAVAVSAGVGMGAAGAAIIDVGGETTQPGASAVWEGDEIARVMPVVEGLARAGVAISVDTRKAAVMETAVRAGAHLINDVSALLYDDRAEAVAAAAGVPVVLMHHQGDPETMQKAPRYADVLLDVFDWLDERIERAVAAGIPRDRIIVDPGIGFGKALGHNLGLINGLALFHGLGCPVLLGASRKRLIAALDNEAPADRRLGGSLALVSAALDRGVQLVRVHDVPETVQMVRVWRGLRDEALTPRGG